MALIKVYRAENDELEGMYSSEVSRFMFELQSRHPSPHDDMALKGPWNQICDDDRTSEFHFGFSSIEQLKFWIYMEEWRQGLTEEGFKISVYEIEEAYTLIGETQCVFQTEYAQLDHRLSLLEI